MCLFADLNGIDACTVGLHVDLQVTAAHAFVDALAGHVIDGDHLFAIAFDVQDARGGVGVDGGRGVERFFNVSRHFIRELVAFAVFERLPGEDGGAAGFQAVDAAAREAVATCVVDGEVVAAVARDYKGLGVVVVGRVVRALPPPRL